MKFGKLPQEIKEKIFFLLPGDTLNICVKVCQDWRKIINGDMKARIQKILDENIFENDVQHEVWKSIGLDYNNLSIAAISSRFVLLSTDGVPLLDSIVLVYNIEKGFHWEVDHLTYDIARLGHNSFKTVMNDKFVAMLFFLHSSNREERLNIVRLWSLRSFKLIFEKEVKNCDHIACDSLKNKRILVLFHEKLEIVSFTEDDGEDPKISRIIVDLNDNVKKYGILKYPYLSVFENNLSSRISRMYVWKLKLDFGYVEKIVSCEDSNYFAKQQNGQYIIENMDNVQYMCKHFFSTSDKEIRFENEEFDDNVLSYDLVIRVYDNDGMMKKEFSFPKFMVHDELYVTVVVFERKLFLQIEGELYVYKGDIEQFFEDKDVSEGSFTPITQLFGNFDIMFQKYALVSASIRRDRNNNFELFIKKMNYY